MNVTQNRLEAGRPSAGKKQKKLTDLADKPATVRVNFDLERGQHTKLKVYAAKQGQTVKEVLTELVAQLPD